MVRLLILMLMLLAVPAFATERDYSLRFCQQVGGQAEYVLTDHSRVDCLTDTVAWEVEYAKHWQSAVGQSLFYAMETGKRPGIAVIYSDKDARYLRRLSDVAEKYGIEIYKIKISPPANRTN